MPRAWLPSALMCLRPYSIIEYIWLIVAAKERTARAAVKCPARRLSTISCAPDASGFHLKSIQIVLRVNEVRTALLSRLHQSCARFFKRFPGSLKRIEIEAGLAGWAKDQMFGVLHLMDRTFEIRDDVWRDHNGAVSIRVYQIARIDSQTENLNRQYSPPSRGQSHGWGQSIPRRPDSPAPCHPSHA